ncbi:MAG: hypothetical protein ABSD99_06280 [Candidatus Bathyarchaeia archaeon]
MSNRIEIEISADISYKDEELKELAASFGNNFKIRITRHERLTGISLEQLAPILIITFNPITKGFLESVGKEVFERFKKKLLDIAKKQDDSQIVFTCADSTNKVELNVKSKSVSVLRSALETVDNTVQIMQGKKDAVLYFDFDSDKNQWIQNDISTRKVAFPVEGVMATTDRITVRGKPVQFTEEQLRKIASELPGTPMLHEHGGSPIGEWKESWYEDGKLMVRGVVYEPRDERERDVVEQIKTGKLRGLSLGYSDEP